MRSLRKLAWFFGSWKNPARRKLRRGCCKRFARRSATRICGESSAGWRKLPLDLREAVLTRLPFAQVFQFRLVCKQWHRILSDPAFLKRCLAFQNACTHCVFGNSLCKSSGSIGSGFDPSSGSWQALPPTPAELGSLAILSSDKGLVVGYSMLHRCLCVYNPLLQLYRLLPACGQHDCRVYVHLVVDAAARTFKVYRFSFYGNGWERIPCFRRVERVLPPHNTRSVEEVPLPLKNGFSKVHVFDSTSDSWTRLPQKPPLNFSTSDEGFSPPRGTCADPSGNVWFEARDQALPHHLISFLSFNTAQGVWREQKLPPLQEVWEVGIVSEHLLQCDSDMLFLRATAERVLSVPEPHLPIFLHVYRFDKVTESWVTVRRTGSHFQAPQDLGSPLLKAMIRGDQILCRDKMIFWFTPGLGQAMGFSLVDGQWRVFPAGVDRAKKHILTFSLVPSFIELGGMASATSPVRSDPKCCKFAAFPIFELKKAGLLRDILKQL